MTNTSTELPPLRPPRSEIPPGFWELHTRDVIGGGILLALFVTLVIWRITRPRLPRVVSPFDAAVSQLDALRSEPAGAELAGKLGRILRAFATTTFTPATPGLASAELIDTLRRAAAVPPARLESLATFLERCDAARYTGTSIHPVTSDEARILLSELNQVQESAA